MPGTHRSLASSRRRLAPVGSSVCKDSPRGADHTHLRHNSAQAASLNQSHVLDRVLCAISMRRLPPCSVPPSSRLLPPPSNVFACLFGFLSSCARLVSLHHGHGLLNLRHPNHPLFGCAHRARRRALDGPAIPWSRHVATIAHHAGPEEGEKRRVDA